MASSPSSSLALSKKTFLDGLKRRTRTRSGENLFSDERGGEEEGAKRRGAEEEVLARKISDSGQKQQVSVSLKVSLVCNGQKQYLFVALKFVNLETLLKVVYGLWPTAKFDTGSTKQDRTF